MPSSESSWLSSKRFEQQRGPGREIDLPVRQRAESLVSGVSERRARGGLECQCTAGRMAASGQRGEERRLGLALSLLETGTGASEQFWQISSITALPEPAKHFLFTRGAEKQR